MLRQTKPHDVGMDAPNFAVSTHWPAPNPELAAALIGAVLAGQGFIPPRERGSAPWTATDLADRFDRCSAWISNALKGGSLTLAEVREGVMGGWFTLWSEPDGCMVSETILSPRMRAIHVFVAGGTMRAISVLTPSIEEFARMAGFNFGGATGRKGWVRALRRQGYVLPALATVEKAL